METESILIESKLYFSANEVNIAYNFS